jgi:hypothetical protein
MRNVLRFLRQQQRLTLHIYKNKNKNISCNRPLSCSVSLQLRYTSTMAEKQNSEVIIEKVKNLALGNKSRGNRLIIGETSEKDKKGDASQKKDKKKDKKVGGASSLEVILLLRDR